MVHWAALKMTTVLKDLFRHLTPKNLQSLPQPAVDREVDSSEDERLRVDEELVSKQVVLHCMGEIVSLLRQAGQYAICRVLDALDPVHDPQRKWIGLPSRTVAAGIVSDPTECGL